MSSKEKFYLRSASGRLRKFKPLNDEEELVGEKKSKLEPGSDAPVFDDLLNEVVNLFLCQA